MDNMRSTVRYLSVGVLCIGFLFAIVALIRVGGTAVLALILTAPAYGFLLHAVRRAYRAASLCIALFASLTVFGLTVWTDSVGLFMRFSMLGSIGFEGVALFQMFFVSIVWLAVYALERKRPDRTGVELN